MTDKWLWLNYHHLLYFMMVVEEGGLVPEPRLLALDGAKLREMAAQLRVAERELEGQHRHELRFEVHRLAEIDPFWIEEPTHPDDVSAHAALVRECRELVSRAGRRELLVYTEPHWQDALTLYESLGFRRFGRDEVDLHLRLRW